MLSPQTLWIDQLAWSAFFSLLTCDSSEHQHYLINHTREHQTLLEIRCFYCACHQDGFVISFRLPYVLSNTISHAEEL